MGVLASGGRTRGAIRMILDGFLSLITTLVNWVYAMLPAWTIDLHTIGGAAGTSLGWQGVQVGQLSPFEAMLAFAASYNDFVPVDQLLLITSLAVSFYAAFLAWRFGRWIIGVIRGAGTS